MIHAITINNITSEGHSKWNEEAWKIEIDTISCKNNGFHENE